MVSSTNRSVDFIKYLIQQKQQQNSKVKIEHILQYCKSTN